MDYSRLPNLRDSTIKQIKFWMESKSTFIAKIIDLKELPPIPYTDQGWEWVPWIPCLNLKPNTRHLIQITIIYELLG